MFGHFATLCMKGLSFYEYKQQGNRNKELLLLSQYLLRWKNLLVPSRRNDVVTTLLRSRFPTSLWRRHIVAMETLEDVAKTTSLQRLTKRRHNETLQGRHFWNVVWRFHRNYTATSQRHWVVTSQRRCKVVLSNGKQI